MNFADAIRQMGKLSFLIGESESGQLICADMEQNPHLFIAGVTGTGKSVFLHSVLLSLMLHNQADDLRFILCDSKMVELGQYNETSHLLVPPITDLKRINAILQWAEHETYHRLTIFSQSKKKSLQAYNDYLRKNSTNKLPRIVLAVDDMSIVAMQEPSIIEKIKRIILNGRISGIHLLLITQAITQKSVREIAKMIPSKVVFLTLTEQESKFLIAKPFACQLTAPGSAIFSAFPGNAIHIKTIMSDQKTSEIILSVSKRTATQYDKNIIRFVEEKTYPCTVKPNEQVDNWGDLFTKAMDIVLDTGQASVSILQRKLNLGYSVSTRLIDQMERNGFVGPFAGSKPRQILITKSCWKKIIGGNI